MGILKQLAAMQGRVGTRSTHGLSDAQLHGFLQDQQLVQAVADGEVVQQRLIKEFPTLALESEERLMDLLQADFVNFYAADQRNPYIPVAGRGPWLVTFHGAVLHDSGGYGMIGFGHTPDTVLKAMSTPQVMANIMTPSFSQLRLGQRLKREIGSRRGGVCPFDRFICMNSGSEAVTVATRISDINAKKMTDPGGRHAGKRLMYLSLKGGFHGRTEKPAMLSDSSAKAYRANLASFRNLNINYTVEPNNLADLKAAFDWADQQAVFFESMYVEPVMGEGDPGKAITPEFYALARQLTAASGTLLVIDSIQAGIRAQGYLSLTDYPGFEALLPPDMETYSKALNAGQYPLSILALTQSAAKIYVRGVYGNTKTANPRALDVAVAVLELVTPALRQNIQAKGHEFLQKFSALGQRHPQVVHKVQGTGLIISIDISADAFNIIGIGQLEEYLRKKGIGVIHGGTNSLRFTPHFAITSEEIDLITAALEAAFISGPRLKKV